MSIPADANPADNDFYFVFEQAGAAEGDRRGRGRSGGPAAGAGGGDLAGPGRPVLGRGARAGQLGGVDWDQVALLLWQAPLPDKDAAEPLRAFVERGGSAIFFPPRAPGRQHALRRPLDGVAGAQGREPRRGRWRGDEDLLANTQSGASLPVGQLQVRRSCGLSAAS